MKGLISIIVPVYNVKPYLNKCIDSIISQTYKNLEIFLVDDGSNDGSAEICDYYKSIDDRIIVIHKDNGGQGSARNRALDICNGEYIAFVDSDDYVDIDMYEYMIGIIDSTDCDMVQCGYRLRSIDGRETKVSYVTENIVGDTEQLIYSYLTGKVSTVMWNKLYRAFLFDNIRFPEICCREDVYILHEILGECKKYVTVPECKYVQNCRDNSTEQKRFDEEKMKITYEALAKLRSYISEKFPHYKNMTDIRFVRMYYGFLKEVVVKNEETPESTVFVSILEKLKHEIALLDIDSLYHEHKNELERIIIHIQNPKRFYRDCKIDRYKMYLKKYLVQLRKIINFG